MKIFIADSVKKGYVNDRDFHWTKDGEPLFFSIIQKPDDPSMTGVSTRKSTTHIVVAECNKDRNYLVNLLTMSLEDALAKPLPEYKQDIELMVDEVIQKASQFKEGDRVSCRGRELFLSNG